MTRLCGWSGYQASDQRGRELLAAMAGVAVPELERAGACFVGPSCALAVAPGATPSSAHREAGLWVAVEGRVHFDDPTLSREAGERGASAALASGYREHGADVLERTRGAFALAVLAPESGEVLLAVDRIGGRHPLAFKCDDDALVFGSDCGVLQPHPLGRSEVDPQAIFNYLYFHVVPGPATIRQGVSRLMPGECLRFAKGVARCERYWQIAYEERNGVGVEALSAEFREVLRKSVGREAGPDVGCFLSGGTDSSTVVGVLSEVTGEPVRAYAIGFDAEGYDEMRYARVAARHFGATLREYYLAPADLLEAVPLIAQAHAEPFGNASAVPAYYCAKMARSEGVRRLLGGDGGDELFGGNERYRTQQVFDLYDKVPSAVRRYLLEPLTFGFPAGERLLPVRKARSYIRQAKVPMPQRLQTYNYLERLGIAEILEADFLSRVDAGNPLALLKGSYDSARAGSMLNRMLAMDLRFTLADNDIPKVSRSCELADVAVSYPLLSDELVDFARRVPPRLNLRYGKLRWFFKHALRDFLPREVLRKSKHGFGLPFGVWMRDHPELREMARESVGALRERGVVRGEFIDELLRLHGTEHAGYYGVMIWVLMMLEQWFVAHVDHAAPAAR